MKARKPRTSRALLDIILSVMAMIVLLIAPPTEGDLLPKVDYVIEVSWPEKIDIDIDTWVLLPNGDKMFFRNKDTGYVSIDRDDLGKTNDPAPPNIEITNIRAPLDGIYYVSVHNYRSGQSYNSEWDVRILFRKIENKQTWYYEIPMPEPRKETSVFKFIIHEGKLIDVSKSDRKIIG